VCFEFLYSFRPKYFSFRAILSNIYTSLRVKYPLFLPHFNKNYTFLTDFSKTIQISNFIKIRPVGAQRLRADGQADMMMLTVAFCNFSKAANNNIITSKSPFVKFWNMFNPLNAELNPICHLLALLGAHHILHVSRIRVKAKCYAL